MLPDFPEMRPLSISDGPIIQSFYRDKSGCSDHEFGSLLSWNYSGRTRISQLLGNLVVSMADYASPSDILTVAGSHRAADTAALIFSAKRQLGQEMIIRMVPSDFVDSLPAGPFHVEPDRDNFDYIISAAKLSRMEGREFYQARRLGQRFERVSELNIESYCAVDNAVREEILSLCDEWKLQKSKQEDDLGYRHERIAIDRCLKNLESIQATVYVARIGKALAAFWIVGRVSQTKAISHFEKSRTWVYPGLVQVLKREVAGILDASGVSEINLEQDLGIDGLRRSKTSYVHLTFFPCNSLEGGIEHGTIIYGGEAAAA